MMEAHPFKIKLPDHQTGKEDLDPFQGRAEVGLKRG
jgi:hypothetical protein